MPPKIIVFGNQKGGTGKSTLAMHLTVSLLIQKYKVATMDVDSRQGTFSRYIENREFAKQNNPQIPTPTHSSLLDFDDDSFSNVAKANKENFTKIMESYKDFDFVVIDTPGNDNNLSKIAHSFADVIITPINESFVDLDLLVRINQSKENELRPSIYAEMVWNQRKERALRDKGTIDWFVLVNRMSSIPSKNRYEFDRVLSALSKRIGFRLAHGFKERVVFRELFLSGLTLLDRNVASMQTSLSHIAARQELNDLMKTLGITSTND
jgi:chromosome partitioning protein